MNHITSDFSDKHLNDMLTRYSSELASATSNENIELEIRFKDVTRSMFESIYTAIINNNAFATPTLECSVNVISNNMVTAADRESSYIRKLVFTGPKLAAEIYQKKTRLMRPAYINGYIKCAVGLSKESTITKFNSSSDAVVRFKVRVSFEYKKDSQPGPSSKWRYDLTAVRSGSLSGLKSMLKTIKYDLFTDKLDAKSLLATLNFDAVDAFEIEIEYIDKATRPQMTDFAVIQDVFSLVNPQYLTEAAYQEEIYKIAEYIITNHEALRGFRQPTHRLKQLANQVIALTKNTYYMDIYPPTGYYLTVKADGLRAIVSIDGNRCRIMQSTHMNEYIAGDKYVSGEVTIADVELIVAPGNNTQYTIYVFDVMVLRDENISKSGFSVRIEYISEATELINSLLTRAKSTNKALAKAYIKLDTSNLEAGFREMWESESPFPRDGLILTEPNEPYISTKNYKWKPADRNTIDFLAIKAPQKMLGIKPYEVRKGFTLYLLFVGIDHKMRESLGLGFLPQYKSIFSANNSRYYPIQFSPSANPLAYIYYHKDSDPVDLDKQIIELSRAEDDKGWIFHGIRSDRKMAINYYGNDYRFAELTYTNFIDPFSFEALWKPSDSYFTKTAAGIYTAAHRYKRFVISLLLAGQIRGAKYIIDLASGRGADLHRYQELGVENTLFIDVDATAIAELIRRKYSFFASKKRQARDTPKAGRPALKSGADDVSADTAEPVQSIEYDKLIVKDIKAMTVHTLVADLKAPYTSLITNVYQFGINTGSIDGIICNFALHYMCDTIEHLRNILLFISRMLKVGGVFMFTVMDGEAVFNLLKDVAQGKCWTAREGTVTKYAIRKDYSGAKISDVGQMIAVMLPFSDKMYPEPLCNVRAVISEASKLGLKVELNESMAVHMTEFAQADKALHGRLSDEDKAYIALHRSVVLRLVKRPKQ